MKYILILLFLSHYVALAQEGSQDIRLPEPKRFIDRVEVFAGPGLSFNYGNKFVENYKDENVQNKRLLKVGYNVGIGLYHPVSERIDINARVQYEQKGNKNELNVPLNPVNDDSRVIINSEYSYRFLTLSIAPQIYFGKNKQWMIGLGGYLSKIKQVQGYDQTHVLRDNFIEESSFIGRVFRDLRPDGAVYSTSWMRGLSGIEKNDYGAAISIGYATRIKENKTLVIQIVDNFGFENINRNNSYNLKEQNHVVYLIVGFTLQHPIRNKS